MLRGAGAGVRRYAFTRRSAEHEYPVAVLALWQSSVASHFWSTGHAWKREWAKSLGPCDEIHGTCASERGAIGFHLLVKKSHTQPRSWGTRLVVDIRADDCALALDPMRMLLPVRLHCSADSRASADAVGGAAQGRRDGERRGGGGFGELACGSLHASDRGQFGRDLQGHGADGTLAQQPVHLVLRVRAKAIDLHVVKVQLLGTVIAVVLCGQTASAGT